MYILVWNADVVDKKDNFEEAVADAIEYAAAYKGDIYIYADKVSPHTLLRVVKEEAAVRTIEMMQIINKQKHKGDNYASGTKATNNIRR